MSPWCIWRPSVGSRAASSSRSADLDPEVARTVGARYGVPGFTDPLSDDRGRPPGRGPDQHAARSARRPGDRLPRGRGCRAVGEAGGAPRSRRPSDWSAGRRITRTPPSASASRTATTRPRWRSASCWPRASSVRSGEPSRRWPGTAVRPTTTPRPWRGQRARSGGGTLINQAIHTIDLLQWFLGDVTAVGGRAGTYLLGDVIDVEDSAQLILDHPGGVRSVCFATNTAPSTSRSASTSPPRRPRCPSVAT